MLNGEKIKQRCQKIGKNYYFLCEKLRISSGSLDKMLDGRRPMNLFEAEIIQKELGIPDEEFCDYFFVNAVNKISFSTQKG